MNLKDLSASDLRERRRQLVQTMPPVDQVMRGTLLAAYKRCGRPNCHCVNGPGHGPKHYLSVSQQGATRAEIMCAIPTSIAPLSSSATCNYFGPRSTRYAPSTPSYCGVTKTLDRQIWLFHLSSST